MMPVRSPLDSVPARCAVAQTLAKDGRVTLAPTLAGVAHAVDSFVSGGLEPPVRFAKYCADTHLERLYPECQQGVAAHRLASVIQETGILGN